jgi:hypothetical protein
VQTDRVGLEDLVTLELAVGEAHFAGIVAARAGVGSPRGWLAFLRAER